jgi:2-aminoadipate transaminase
LPTPITFCFCPTGITHSALQQGLLQDHLHHTIRPALEAQCTALCDALARHLPACTFHRPQGGYFVWLELPQQVDSRALLQLASSRYAVKFAPGAVCQGQPNCVRLSFSFYEPQDLAVGVERLAAALQAYLSDNP